MLINYIERGGEGKGGGGVRGGGGGVRGGEGGGGGGGGEEGGVHVLVMTCLSSAVSARFKGESPSTSVWCMSAPYWINIIHTSL